LVEAQPLICLSFSDGLQSAVDLVQYCNGPVDSTWGSKRAANGHPAPYKVKYWQIGNEIGGDDPAYLDAVTDFCRKMKQIDPSISCLASFPSQKLLDRAGKDIAYLGPHHYTPDFVACDQDFANLGRMIHDTPGCNHVKIAVTEWNVSAGAWGLLRGKFLTLDTALLNARYLNLLMRHSDKAEIACRSNLANSFGSGIIETSPAGLLKRPSYFVMKLYADHVKPILLSVSNTSAGLDMIACASENRRSISVFVVNLKPEPAHISPVLEGSADRHFALKAYAVRDTLDAGQLEVMNHWSDPDRVRIVEIPASERELTIPPYSASVIDIETDK
jgi:alpha-N-arabinofuranosidase